MSSPNSTYSIHQYVSDVQQRMSDPQTASPVELGYAAEGKVSSVHFQTIQALTLEIALSRQFWRLR